jgi:hypothetical protein
MLSEDTLLYHLLGQELPLEETTPGTQFYSAQNMRLLGIEVSSIFLSVDLSISLFSPGLLQRALWAVPSL